MPPKGSGSELLSSDVQNAARRAAKNRRKQRTSTAIPSECIFDLIEKDKRRSQQRTGTAEKRRQELRLQQVELAFGHPAYQALECGSLAEKYASGILLKFRTIEPMGNKSKLESAAVEVQKILTDEERQREGALKKGYAVAREALNTAFEVVGQQLAVQPRSA